MSRNRGTHHQGEGRAQLVPMEMPLSWWKMLKQIH